MKKLLACTTALSLFLSSAQAQIQQPGIGPKGGVLYGHLQQSAFDILAKSIIATRANNPRINAVMASPPTITSSASHNAALTNITGFATSASGIIAGTSAMNFYGGAMTDDGAGARKFVSTTVSGSLVQYVWRLHTIADSTKFEVETICISGTCKLNIIVDGKYQSLTVNSPGISGVAFTTFDFSAVGARAVRDIQIEFQNADFIQIALGPTETITKPPGYSIRGAIVADSMGASGGMLVNFMGFPQIFADMVGIRDLWNLGVGGTGIIAAGGQLTCPQRISDLVAAAPDIIFLTCGRNDTGSSAGAVTAAMLAWLVAIRAQPTLAKTPIVVFVAWGNTALATEQATEAAIQSAVTTFNDPLVFMIPNANNAAGPVFTGTGFQGATTGSGNSDLKIWTDGVHPDGQTYGSPASPVGHWFEANWLANAFQQQILLK